MNKRAGPGRAEGLTGRADFPQTKLFAKVSKLQFAVSHVICLTIQACVPKASQAEPRLEISTPRRAIRGGVSEVRRLQTIDRACEYDGC
jgi:hypothetical protein